MSKINPIPGETVASFFKRNKKLSACARLGAEKKQDKGWVRVSTSYVIRSGDSIRLRSAQGGHSNARGLESVVRSIVLSQKR